ncbi:lysozyme [Novosphingobium sp. JCM 18896]|uniref:lysozyme n=1 Tax=Novosphingobium sp. JCM 18896 TaxID=2989731 RepID=UPI0022238D83|nr:lysozyme [Novosphingobium sp. JCM 18896]MCW1431412.1 lysozyme [Novosphingobium sp. JCM 18896]
MSLIDRREIFQAVKALRKGQGFTLAEVQQLDAAIDRALANVTPQFAQPPPTGRQVGQRGIDLMHQFEGCQLEAYPDPGSKDGNPWTIGYGSTGPGIAKGVRWTQAQADARFAEDLAKFAARVDALIGDAPTDQSQFEALVSLAYNIGLDALKKSTVLRKHKAGDHAGAAAAFHAWRMNDGKVMKGLVRRRAAEAQLYLADD